MRHVTEFNRFAKSYGNYNIIQREVAKKVAASIPNKPQSIIDLGCGSGTLYDALPFQCEKYVAVDLSKAMLELHPKSRELDFIHSDFDDPKLYETLQGYSCDYLVSSSSLQWSRNLYALFEQIKSLVLPFSLALFTSGTFKSVHQTAGINSPLLSADEVIRFAKQVFQNVEVEREEYRLSFDSSQELFRYIKRSGVSGSRRQLNYRQTKELIASYPQDYLEFEVVFLNHRIESSLT